MLSACGHANSGNTADSAKIEASGDWDRASNLNEAIYDIQTSDDDRSGSGFTISFYNIDHTSTDDIFRQVHFIHTSSSILRSSLPEFTGRIDCGAHCQSGSLLITHNAPGSRLNGTVRIQFNQTPMQLFSKSVHTVSHVDPVEGSIAHALQTHFLLGGTIEQYQVIGGWVIPFQLTLGYSTSFIGQTPNETLSFHGTKLRGSTVTLAIQNSAGSASLPLSATISLPSRDSIEICFETDQAIVALGAYGPSHDSAPVGLCSSSKF